MGGGRQLFTLYVTKKKEKKVNESNLSNQLVSQLFKDIYISTLEKIRATTFEETKTYQYRLGYTPGEFDNVIKMTCPTTTVNSYGYSLNNYT